MARNVLLFAANFADAKAEVEAAGGVVTQRFSDRVFVADVPELLQPGQLAHATATIPPDLDQDDQILVRAWMNRGQKIDSEQVEQDEGLPWDAPGHEPPGKI